MVLHAQYDLLVTPQLADRCVRSRPQRASGRRSQTLVGMVAFHLSVQLDAAAGSMRAVRIYVGGLPVAMQLVVPKFNDTKVLRGARAYETVRPFAMPTSRAHQSCQPAGSVIFPQEDEAAVVRSEAHAGGWIDTSRIDGTKLEPGSAPRSTSRACRSPWAAPGTDCADRRRTAAPSRSARSHWPPRL